MHSEVFVRIFQEWKNSEFACVFHKERAYVAFLPRQSKFASTPTLKLIQNIFEEHKDLSFFILRQRIFTSITKNELDAGLVKVTAKRIQFDVQIQSLDFQTQLREAKEVIIVGESQTKFQSRYQNPIDEKSVGQKIHSTSEGFQFLKNLVVENQPKDLNEKDLHDRNRNVGAMLLDADNKILAYAVNSSAINKTLHAEMILVQDYLEKTKNPLPNGSKILVTHKPCKMCAGIVFEAAKDPKEIEVYYEIEETGSHSKSTILDKQNLNKKFESKFI